LAVVLDQADSLVAWPVGPGPAGAADPAVARPGGLGYPAGVGPVVLDHRKQFVAGVNGRDLAAMARA
jgi:hypothetical protein